jgi:hypothetical protein
MAVHYTQTQLEDMLAKVDEAIDKARTAQSYNAGSGMSVSRGLLKDLYDERKWILGLLAPYGTTGTGDNFINKVQFERPR